MREALAGDVQRAAVIRRGADERQAEAELTSLIPREHLKRNQPLIVIPAHHRIIPLWVDEESVRRKRALNAGARGAEAAKDRRENPPLLVPEGARFPGVGIQSADGQAWSTDPEILSQSFRGHLKGRAHERGRDPRRI